MKKEIFDLLVELAPEPPTSDTSTTKIPEVEVSSNLAFGLDTLMNTVAARMNRSADAMFEDLLTRGIADFVRGLSEGDRKAIGLDTPEAKPPQRNRPPEDEEVDQMAVMAQQAAFDKMNEAFGYTPMTAHAVPEKNGNGKGRGKSNNAPKKSNRKKKVRPAKKHGRGGGQSGGQGGGGGGRRRRGSDGRSHSQR